MGRKDTITAKNIQKMYEQLCLDQRDILHRTKLLLSVYRDVVWITLNKSANLTEELIYYGDDLNGALIYLEQFSPEIERQEFEKRVSMLNIPPQTGQQNGENRSRDTAETSPGVRLQVQAVE